MAQEINICDSVNCLTKLVSLKSSCITGNCTPFYIEDLEGIDLEFLNNTANAQQITAEKYAKDVIDSASRLMLSDLQMLMSGGISLIQTFGEVCSTCTYQGSFQAGGGVVVRNLIASKFSVIKISKLEIHCNGTGIQNIVFDDGKTVKKFAFEAMGVGTLAVVLVEYITTETVVKIYLENVEIGLQQIDCGKVAGCGCGGSSVSRETQLSYSGYLLGMLVSQQYGIKVCATVVCSSDIIICSMVNSTPNMFGATLLYKIGSILYSNSSASRRVNRTTAFNEEITESMQAYYERLYNQRLKGSTGVPGLNSIVTDYMKRNKDKCTECTNVFSVSYATG